MSSVANRKYTDMKQIEFQQTGSSRMEAMLLQPLLEKSSTYMCEITDLQLTIGEELAFPEEQWLFSIVRRPHSGQHHLYTAIVPNAIDRYSKALSQVGKKAPSFEDSGVYGWYEQDQIMENGNLIDTLEFIPNVVWDADNDELEHFTILFNRDDIYEERRVFSNRYYSTLDFVTDIAMQVKQWDMHQAGEEEIPSVTWNVMPEDDFHMLTLTVDSGGHLVFNMTPTFVNNYHIITSPLFQAVTGFPTFVGHYARINGANVLIETILDIAKFGELTPADLADTDVDDFDVEEIYYFTGDFSYIFSSYTNGVDFSLQPTIAEIRSTLVRDVIPIQDGIDVRRSIILEVSLPVSHTLSWDGNKEDTKFMLQEFRIPTGFVTMKYTSNPDYRENTVQIKQVQNQGQLVLLDSGSGLAVKKLFEGQMQAFRLNLLITYNRWDTNTFSFVKTTKELNIGEGGFFYLKLLFTKETA